MSTIANIVLADAQATPVSQTFAPVVANGTPDGSSLAVFHNRAAGVSLAFEKLELNVSMASKNRPTNKVAVRMTRPVLETITGSTVAGTAPAPTVAYTPRVDMVFTFPPRTTLEQRQSLRKMAMNALDNALLKGAIEQFDNPI